MPILTIKFSQFATGGDLTQGDTTVGLLGGVNTSFSNPWTFLASGPTADRPIPSSAIDFRLRLNTDLSVYEYYDPNVALWVELSGSGTGTVNPGVANDLAFYAANGTAISPIAAMANAVLITNGSDIPSLSTTLPSGLTIPGATITGSTAALTSGSVVAAPVAGTDLVNKTYADGLFASGVQSITGTTNQIIASSATGNVTLSLPQNIALGSTPTFGGLTLSSIPLNGASGGTGIANTGLTINLGTATTGYVLTSDSSGNATWQANPGSIGINTVDGDSGSATGLSGVVTISGGTTGLTTSGSTHTLSLTGTLKLANGGTNAALTASNGGIVYSTASALAILAGTATAGQLLQSGSSTTPAWSTTTYPATNAANTLLYASSANVMGALATANDGVLITSNSGVPSWLANSGTPGYVLTANSGAPPSWQNIQADGAITAVNTDSGNVTPLLGAVTISGGTTGLTTSGLVSTVTLGGTLKLANGGTNASLTASNGGIFYSTASAAAILAGTATANQILMSGASTTPAWSTATYPATAGTSGNVLTSNGTNWVSSTPMVITDWVAYTPTFTGFGTVSAVSIWSKRIADTLYIQGSFTSGTSTATTAEMTLGFNGTNANVSASATLVANPQMAGPATVSTAAAANFIIIITPSSGFVTFGIQNSSRGGLTAAQGSTLIASGTALSFTCQIPVDTWP